MKQIYFGEGSNKHARRALQLTTSIAYSIAPKLTLKTSYKVLVNPFSRREVKFKDLSPHAELKVATAMGDVHLYKFGQGERNILITHGWADTAGSLYYLIKNYIDKGFTVWTFDHIGHGLSDGNYSHLFGFIDGLNSVLKRLTDLDIEIEALIGHSMGCAAIMNLNKDLIEDKKIVFLAAPIKFFESMFEKMESVGIAKRILRGLLEDVSVEYEKNWRELHPFLHESKVGSLNEVLFIHDVNDKDCPYLHVKEYTDRINVPLMTTEGLGHRKVLRDNNVIKQMNDFII